MNDNISNCLSETTFQVRIYKVRFNSSTIYLRIPIFMAASINAFPFPVKCDNPTPIM